jgi:hypothetical protein
VTTGILELPGFRFFALEEYSKAGIREKERVCGKKMAPDLKSGAD